MTAVREAVRAQLHALGFDEVRFARVTGPDDLAPEAAGLRAWLDAGRHADMAWMERTAEKRADPHRVVPGARTVIALGVNYWDGASAAGTATLPPHLAKPRDESVASPSESRPEIENPISKPQNPVWARYALHADYHDTFKPALAAAGRVLEELAGAAPTDYRYYTDTGPVLERGWAARAGLGFVGKNAMLISPRHGNWLLLAAIVTAVEFESDELRAPLARKTQSSTLQTPNRRAAGAIGSLCGKCTRCLDACPTAAFAAPGVVDARRCVSYQTIENRGIIPRELRPGIGARIFGCDVCLAVCPWNRFAQAGRRTLLDVRGEIAALSLREILELTPTSFANVFRKTSVKRLKLAGLLRNACVAAGNAAGTGDNDCNNEAGDGPPGRQLRAEYEELLDQLVRLASHESPIVRAHAVWAVFRHGSGSRLTAARAAETDSAVLAEYAAEPA